jgi:hypothetical protein
LTLRLLPRCCAQEENMVSNKDIQEKYKDFNDFEDDFM